MPVNPVWLGAVLALTPGVVRADPAPTPIPTPVIPFRVPEFPQALLLSGRPFPQVTPVKAVLAKPDRTLFVAAKKGDGGASGSGDGSEGSPFHDLQAALRALEPGDRLRVGPGDYAGPIRIDETCKEGTRRRTIQVVFDSRAKLAPGGGVGAAALTVRRAFWHLSGTYVSLDQSASPGIAIEGDAHDVLLDGARVSGGAGPSVSVGGGTVAVRVANARISKSRLERSNPDAVGIAVLAGARDTLIANNQLSENPGGSVRVQAPSDGGKPASAVQVVGNSIRDDAATAIDVEAADGVRIAGNTITDSPTWSGTRGIALGSVRRAIVRENAVTDVAIGIQVGEAGEGGESREASGVTVDHNYVVETVSVGTGVRLEAARDTRVVHNVLERVGEAFAIAGRPPRTQGVTVVNNLAVGVAKVGFAIDDPKSVLAFDYNLFSPASEGVTARLAGREMPLAKALEEGKMSHSKVARGVRIQNHDLARIEGAEVRDQGSTLGGFPHRGSAPDLGIEER
ncbi:MAG TPA: right-handed parallel beta-helix repeat-containing protein [Thermoanaerobaculia bacterium]